MAPFCAPSARAARIAVQVPFIESDTPISEGRRNKFHDTLVAGLKEAPGPEPTVIAGAEVRAALGDKPNLLICYDGPCLHEVAELVQADRLIVARITLKSAVVGSAYRIALSVYEQSGAALPLQGSETCGDDSEGCNLSRALAALKRSTASLAKQLDAPLRPAPPSPAMPAPARSSVPVALGGLRAPFSLKDPMAAETAAPSPAPQAKVYRYGYLAAAVATGGLVIASIPFFVFYGRESQNETPCGTGTPFHQCPTVYEGNLGPALGLLLGGGLLGVGAFTTLYYLERREQRRLSKERHAQLDLPRLRIGGGGAVLSLTGHF